MKLIYLIIVLAPLFGSVIAGFFGAQLGKVHTHRVAIGSVAVAFIGSLVVLHRFVFGDALAENISVYTWLVSGGIRFEVGFLVDQLSAMMITVVTFVSLMVHIYTIGYMQDDPGYQRFFSYIALFTFAMLMLVLSNNFLQLFFGWEAVGVVSYLLIGFWFKRESAIFANLKAFLVNRVGDFGFILGIALIFSSANSLDYAEVFKQSSVLAGQTIVLFPGNEWSLMTVICLLLFVGAMGKSAQFPLHVWLPDSMEGPTPISALIHAATMVTAGIFMVARMSPLYELTETALNVVMVIGAITAISMGLIGIVQNDIKRVVAYSTLSQLGYMTVALGASAYSAAIFHLMTHAFFKALLFLGAGSVIIAMHHDQDMRHMGGLKNSMPYTYWTALIGSLALIGFPGFAGYFSKDAIIGAVNASSLTASGFAYYMLLLGVFVTALYTFRMFFLVFHGEARMDEHTRQHIKESPAVVTVPLILLAIPSLLIGWPTIEPMLFGNYFGDSIMVLPQHDVLSEMAKNYHGSVSFVLHGFKEPAVWLALAGFGGAGFIYLYKPVIAEQIKIRFSLVHRILENKYGFDEAYQFVFAGGSRRLGKICWEVGDIRLIDGLVNGIAFAVDRFAGVLRKIQTGLLYNYAFAMIIGLLVLMSLYLLVRF